MITRGTSNNLDVSVDSFLDRFMDGLEEGDTSNATNKDNHYPEELMAEHEFDLGLGADQDLIESQQQKEHIQEEHQEHQEHKEEEQDQDQQIVNINPDTE